jgi:RNA polymerase sigma factor (sigma-70 family)
MGEAHVVSDPSLVDRLERERRLVAEAQAGNLDAMRPIFDAYASPLYATVILPRVGDAASAEDVLRETFIQAIEKLAQFRWTGTSIYAWLRQIAIHKAYDLHRKTKRTAALIDSLRNEVPTASGRDDLADAMLIAAEEMTLNRRRIDLALDELHPRYRQAIELRLIDELPREECARRLEVSTATFDVVLFRAVRAFRKHFGERAATPPSAASTTSAARPRKAGRRAGSDTGGEHR